MSASDPKAIDRILTGALDLEGEARERYLDEACAGDPELRRIVDGLLQAADSDHGLLREGELQASDEWNSIVGAVEEIDGLGDGEPGDVVGPFRLVEPLGRGGMGIVWRAERADGAFEQQVALKRLRGGAAGGDLARRLVRERQILAHLDHPGIARLVDGGLDEAGRPWFAMELVEGQPFLDACRARDLSIDERVALFEEIANTVHYAHQRLLVHRDIKPANVLVTGDGRPKLLDFGIAKLLDETIDTEALTRTQYQPMTPRYASPEQILGEPITTASDIYQLGLLLYELLVGEPAFDVTDLKISDLVESAKTRAPAQPGRHADLPADLDAIVMTATRPEVDRRYSSVREFADDLRAYLEHRPVRAQGDSVLYRARRFARRHRLGVTVGVATLLAGFALTASVAWGFVRAEQERQRAEAIGAFLKDTLRGAQPFVSKGRDPELLIDIMRDAATRIDSELGERPYAAAELHFTIASTLRTLSDYATAEIHADAASRGFIDYLGPNARESLEARHLLGLNYWDQGRNAEAEEVLRDAYERAQASLPADDPLMPNVISSLALAVRAQGRLLDAEPLYRRAVEASIRVNGLSGEMTITAIGNLAFLLAELDRLEEAEPFAQQAAELARAHLGSDNPDTHLAIDKLATLVRQRGRPAEALELHEEALEGLHRLLGPKHSTTLGSTYASAVTLRELGRFDESIERLEGMVPIIREEYGPESRFMFPTLQALGASLRAAGRPDEAVEPLETALAGVIKVLGPEHHRRAVISIELGETLVETGNRSRAEKLLSEARSLLEKIFGTEREHRHFDELRRVEAMLTEAG